MPPAAAQAWAASLSGEGAEPGESQAPGEGNGRHKLHPTPPLRGWFYDSWISVCLSLSSVICLSSIHCRSIIYHLPVVYYLLSVSVICFFSLYPSIISLSTCPASLYLSRVWKEAGFGCPWILLRGRSQVRFRAQHLLPHLETWQESRLPTWVRMAPGGPDGPSCGEALCWSICYQLWGTSSWPPLCPGRVLITIQSSDGDSGLDPPWSVEAHRCHGGL